MVVEVYLYELSPRDEEVLFMALPINCQNFFALFCSRFMDPTFRSSTIYFWLQSTPK